MLHYIYEYMVIPSIISNILNSIIYTAPHDTQLVNERSSRTGDRTWMRGNWFVLFCTCLKTNTCYVINHMKKWL